MVILLTIIVRVRVPCCQQYRHRSPARTRRPWLELRVVPIHNVLVPQLEGIHILSNLVHGDRWDIPRLLAMPGQHLLVMAFSPHGVLKGVLVDLALLEVLGPPLMLAHRAKTCLPWLPCPALHSSYRGGGSPSDNFDGDNSNKEINIAASRNPKACCHILVGSG